ncbi:helicase C-terminal domain-containing protein [Agrilactobacillus yilanensis]|uniref:3'-5' exonuclease DinG n=1 Tax=Agrilactobacillus yilanensis TaxID=2485997 RepID=A0ABW4JBC0_9LACO|nr:helicase C-terminal domain-containing protein [Agrilactobacillus yilanensis]
MSDKQPIFSVVDLETTGTKRTENRIIQFGCALIEKNKIVNTIAQDINPQQAIPRAITDLTGIDGQQVADAPTFAEIGPALHGMLMDTIFVAHNVNFDFPFLNQAFQDIGLAPLEIKAIDTVELAQILLPTAVSYKLQDLAALLSIQHDNPHHADSDALVTAKLFLALKKRLEMLPTLTLQHLSRLSDLLSRDTGTFIQDLAVKVPKQPLPDYLHRNHGLVLRYKPQIQAQPIHQLQKYPKSPQAKKRILQPALTYRSAQAKMMNLVYENLGQTSSQPLLIEAATGSGKTLGYLLPSYYRATKEHKIVISTATTLLQNQLLDQTLPLLEQLLDAKIPVALVKSNQHYLNLEVYYQSLQMPSLNRPTRILQMRLLVWLTMTKTGDLSELQLTNYENSYLQRVSHHEHVRQSAFGMDEFVRHNERQVAQASIILTNHSYLLKHTNDGTFGTAPSLILDEAEDFSHFARRINGHTSQFEALQELCRHFEHRRDDLLTAAKDIYPASAQITRGFSQLTEITQAIDQLQTVFFESYIQNNISKSKRSEAIHEIIDLTNLDLATYVFPKMTLIEKWLQKVDVNFLQAINQLANMATHFDRQTQILFNQIYSLLNQLESISTQFSQFSEQFLKQENVGVILKMHQYGDLNSLDLNIDILDTGPIASRVFDKFQHVILTGATLTFKHRFDYFMAHLNLNKAEVQTFKLPSPFDYAKQSRLITVANAPDVRVTTPEYFADYISGVIDQIAQTNPGQILVLFNSLEMIKLVYYALKDSASGHQKEVLAQGITGSNEKILKRFSLSQQAILLGSNSFLTGVDLPGEQLRLLILTRLPFESPSQPEVRLRYNWLEAQGKRPFKSEALPKAAFKLKQGFGRLIRNETDQGVMLVLDTRLTNTSYGRQILQTLPKQVENQSLPLNEAMRIIENFLKK